MAYATKWQKHEAIQVKKQEERRAQRLADRQSNDVSDMSRAQRMAHARGADKPGVLSQNAWKNRDEQVEAERVQRQAAREQEQADTLANLPTTGLMAQRANQRSQVIDGVAQAKANFEQDKAIRQQAEDAAARENNLRGQEDAIGALALVWASNRADYPNTPFNNRNLTRLLEEQYLKGGMELNYTALDVCFDWLNKNGYIESGVTSRKRGATTPMAPLEYPQYTTRQASGSTATVKSRTVVTADEYQQLKSKSFEELKRDATASSKPRKDVIARV